MIKSEIMCRAAFTTADAERCFGFADIERFFLRVNMYRTIGKPRIRFIIKLADIPIGISAVFSRTKEFCRDYLTDESPVISVSVSRADIRNERKASIQQAKNEGHSPVRYSVRYLETLALCRKVMSSLIVHNVLLFHGSVIALDGKAYLFTAKSGTGKTTHCRLWLKNIPGCYILNGDKPLLQFRYGKIYACGSPWCGKENYGVNEILPLEAVCILERDKTNHIEEITLKDCFDTLAHQAHSPDGNGNFAKTVSLVKQFSNIKLYRLGCNTEDDAATVSYRAMVEK